MTATVTGRRGEKDTRSLFCKEPAKDTRAESQDTRAESQDTRAEEWGTRPQSGAPPLLASQTSLETT